MELVSKETSATALNSLLRGELSAVETYKQALTKVTDPTPRATLEKCMQSHAQRVTTLSTLVRSLGDTPANTSGPWGAFAKLVEGGAKVFGEKAAVAALEEGEDHGRNNYRKELPKLESETRRMVEAELVPEQRRTHDLMSALKKSMHLH